MRRYVGGRVFVGRSRWTDKKSDNSDSEDESTSSHPSSHTSPTGSSTPPSRPSNFSFEPTQRRSRSPLKDRNYSPPDSLAQSSSTRFSGVHETPNLQQKKRMLPDPPDRMQYSTYNEYFYALSEWEQELRVKHLITKAEFFLLYPWFYAPLELNNAMSERELNALRDRYQTVDRWIWHDMLLLKKIMSCKDISKLNISLRASREAASMPDKFMTVGKFISRGGYGEIYLIRTNKGKRYILKKQTIHDHNFEFRKILREKNAMMLASRNDHVIHIKGSWMFCLPTEYVVYTTMEFADFGALPHYVSKSRPGMSRLSRERQWCFPTGEDNREQILSVYVKVCEEVEKNDENFRKGFRAVLLRFSQELINGLTFLHHQGISHNDLHVNNILIGKGFHIKIIDFGLSVINHPLYSDEHPRFGSKKRKGEEVADTVSMEYFKYSQELESDYNSFLNLLIYLSTGIVDINKIFLSSIQMGNRSRLFLTPALRPIVFYDDFLQLFSGIIAKLAFAKGDQDWDVYIENEIIVFANKHGGEYLNFDPMNYVLNIYGSNNYTTNLESQFDVFTENNPHVFHEVNEDSEETYMHLQGLGFLDESFIRDSEEV